MAENSSQSLNASLERHKESIQNKVDQGTTMEAYDLETLQKLLATDQGFFEKNKDKTIKLKEEGQDKSMSIADLILEYFNKVVESLKASKKASKTVAYIDDTFFNKKEIQITAVKPKAKEEGDAITLNTNFHDHIFELDAVKGEIQKLNIKQITELFPDLENKSKLIDVLTNKQVEDFVNTKNFNTTKDLTKLITLIENSSIDRQKLILNSLTPKKLLELISHINTDKQKLILNSLTPEKLLELMSHIKTKTIEDMNEVMNTTLPSSGVANLDKSNNKRSIFSGIKMENKIDIKNTKTTKTTKTTKNTKTNNITSAKVLELLYAKNLQDLISKNANVFNEHLGVDLGLTELITLIEKSSIDEQKLILNSLTPERLLKLMSHIKAEQDYADKIKEDKNNLVIVPNRKKLSKSIFVKKITTTKVLELLSDKKLGGLISEDKDGKIANIVFNTIKFDVERKNEPTRHFLALCTETLNNAQIPLSDNDMEVLYDNLENVIDCFDVIKSEALAIDIMVYLARKARDEVKDNTPKEHKAGFFKLDKLRVATLRGHVENTIKLLKSDGLKDIKPELNEAYQKDLKYLNDNLENFNGQPINPEHESITFEDAVNGLGIEKITIYDNKVTLLKQDNSIEDYNEKSDKDKLKNFINTKKQLLKDVKILNNAVQAMDAEGINMDFTDKDIHIVHGQTSYKIKEFCTATIQSIISQPEKAKNLSKALLNIEDKDLIEAMWSKIIEQEAATVAFLFQNTEDMTSIINLQRQYLSCLPRVKIDENTITNLREAYLVKKYEFETNIIQKINDSFTGLIAENQNLNDEKKNQQANRLLELHTQCVQYVESKTNIIKPIELLIGVDQGVADTICKKLEKGDFDNVTLLDIACILRDNTGVKETFIKNVVLKNHDFLNKIPSFSKNDVLSCVKQYISNADLDTAKYIVSNANKAVLGRYFTIELQNMYDKHKGDTDFIGNIRNSLILGSQMRDSIRESIRKSMKENTGDEMNDMQSFKFSTIQIFDSVIVKNVDNTFVSYNKDDFRSNLLTDMINALKLLERENTGTPLEESDKECMHDIFNALLLDNTWNVGIHDENSMIVDNFVTKYIDNILKLCTKQNKVEDTLIYKVVNLEDTNLTPDEKRVKDILQLARNYESTARTNIPEELKNLKDELYKQLEGAKETEVVTIQNTQDADNIKDRIKEIQKKVAQTIIKAPVKPNIFFNLDTKELEFLSTLNGDDKNEIKEYIEKPNVYNAGLYKKASSFLAKYKDFMEVENGLNETAFNQLKDDLCDDMKVKGLTDIAKTFQANHSTTFLTSSGYEVHRYFDYLGERLEEELRKESQDLSFLDFFNNSNNMTNISLSGDLNQKMLEFQKKVMLKYFDINDSSFSPDCINHFIAEYIVLMNKEINVINHAGNKKDYVEQLMNETLLDVYNILRKADVDNLQTDHKNNYIKLRDNFVRSLLKNKPKNITFYNAEFMTSLIQKFAMDNPTEALNFASSKDVIDYINNDISPVSGTQTISAYNILLDKDSLLPVIHRADNVLQDSMLGSILKNHTSEYISYKDMPKPTSIDFSTGVLEPSLSDEDVKLAIFLGKKENLLKSAITTISSVIGLDDLAEYKKYAKYILNKGSNEDKQNLKSYVENYLDEKADEQKKNIALQDIKRLAMNIALKGKTKEELVFLRVVESDILPPLRCMSGKDNDALDKNQDKSFVNIDYLFKKIEDRISYNYEKEVTEILKTQSEWKSVKDLFALHKAFQVLTTLNIKEEQISKLIEDLKKQYSGNELCKTYLDKVNLGIFTVKNDNDNVIEFLRKNYESYYNETLNTLQQSKLKFSMLQDDGGNQQWAKITFNSKNNRQSEENNVYAVSLKNNILNTSAKNDADLMQLVQSAVKEAAAANSKKTAKIADFEDKAIKLLYALGRYAQAYPDAEGETAGFTAWRKEKDFQLMLKAHDLKVSKKDLDELATISAMIQKNAKDIETISGKKNSLEHHARSFRLGAAVVAMSEGIKNSLNTIKPQQQNLTT